MDISVIIPMYNTGELIIKCIESITSQNLNLEIIVVDDGSTDNSFQIVNYMCAKDYRIRLLQTDNRGPGNARNVGLKRATGKCIAFIDSDDWIEKNSLDVMYDNTSLNL